MAWVWWLAGEWCSWAEITPGADTCNCTMSGDRRRRCDGRVSSVQGPVFQDPKGLEMKGEHESGIAELVEETRSWELVVVGGLSD